MKHKQLKLGSIILLDIPSCQWVVGDERIYRGQTLHLIQDNGDSMGYWEVVAPSPSFKKYLTGKD
jgi:hypothetical protein